jgi:putative membrane protein
MADEVFRDDDEALHYALARYLCQWLDERGKLWPFYRAFRDDRRADPTGAAAFKRVVGTTPEEAETTRFLAFNQGFYNLFLAVLVAAGILAYAVGSPLVGRTLVLAGAGSMLAAAALLGATSPAHRGAALKQGGAPLLAVVLLLAA